MDVPGTIQTAVWILVTKAVLLLIGAVSLYAAEGLNVSTERAALLSLAGNAGAYLVLGFGMWRGWQWARVVLTVVAGAELLGAVAQAVPGTELLLLLALLTNVPVLLTVWLPASSRFIAGVDRRKGSRAAWLVGSIVGGLALLLAVGAAALLMYELDRIDWSDLDPRIWSSPFLIALGLAGFVACWRWCVRPWSWARRGTALPRQKPVRRSSRRRAAAGTQHHDRADPRAN